MVALLENPMGTDGFEFVEYAAPEPAELATLFVKLGFQAVARHRAKDVTLYRQGDVNFLLNAEPDSFAQAFARVHGAPRSARSPFASRTLPAPAPGRSRSAPSRSMAASGRWRSIFQRSKGSATA